jgi:hypothetical protein
MAAQSVPSLETSDLSKLLLDHKFEMKDETEALKSRNQDVKMTDPRLCFYCEKEGHIKRDCSKRETWRARGNNILSLI